MQQSHFGIRKIKILQTQIFQMPQIRHIIRIVKDTHSRHTQINASPNPSLHTLG